MCNLNSCQVIVTGTLSQNMINKVHTNARWYFKYVSNYRAKTFHKMQLKSTAHKSSAAPFQNLYWAAISSSGSQWRTSSLHKHTEHLDLPITTQQLLTSLLHMYLHSINHSCSPGGYLFRPTSAILMCLPLYRYFLLYKYISMWNH